MKTKSKFNSIKKVLKLIKLKFKFCKIIKNEKKNEKSFLNPDLLRITIIIIDLGYSEIFFIRFWKIY